MSDNSRYKFHGKKVRIIEGKKYCLADFRYGMRKQYLSKNPYGLETLTN